MCLKDLLEHLTLESIVHQIRKEEVLGYIDWKVAP